MANLSDLVGFALTVAIRYKKETTWFPLIQLISSLYMKWKIFDIYLTFIYLPQSTNNNKIKQNSNTKANKSGEEAQKKPWGL